MKIALCFSGQPRDIDIIYPFIKATILDGNDVDVFAHVWWDCDNLSYNSVIPGRVHKLFSPDSIDKINILYQPKRMMVEEPKIWKRKYEVTEKQLEEGPGWARDVDGGLEVGKKYLCNMTNSMFYSVMMSNLLKEQYSVENDIEYDLIIRNRFDFSPHSILNFNMVNLKKDEIICHSTGLPYGMPHDWFAIGKTESMNVYCGVYNHINEIIKQSIMEDGWWCNELHLKHHLKNNNIKIIHKNLLVFGHKGL
jgi:hypothetical protein